MIHQCHCTWADSPHETFAACVRSKGIRVAYCADWKHQDFTAQKRADRELDAYRDARKQGIQPRTTRLKDTRKAVEVSNMTGKAYGAHA